MTRPGMLVESSQILKSSAAMCDTTKKHNGHFKSYRNEAAVIYVLMAALWIISNLVAVSSASVVTRIKLKSKPEVETILSYDHIRHKPEVQYNHQDNLVAIPDCPVHPPCYCSERNGGKDGMKRISCGDLSSNQPFPKFVETSEPVKELSIAYSGLTYLPNSAFEVLKVEELDLQGNSFGDRIASRAFHGVSKRLLVLNLAWTNLTRLPGKVFRGMALLKNLTLAENLIRRLSPIIFQDLRSLEKLSLSGNPLVELPSEIFRYQTGLQSLDLGYCSLDRLPWNLFNGLWNLEMLDLRGNQLHHLEAFTFSDLNSLHTLSLGHNPLKKLQSKVLHGLRHLKVLNLAESYLTKIDQDVFSETKNLEQLDLGDNRLSFIQIGTLLLPHLQHLSLDGNRLTEIPYEVTYLPDLKHLDVSYNQIQTIDKCLLANNFQLDYLNLRENPFHCDCSIFWLRNVKNHLMKKWTDKRKSLPFVPGKCWTPVNLRDIPITSWLDLECFRELNANSNKCNRF